MELDFNGNTVDLNLYLSTTRPSINLLLFFSINYVSFRTQQIHISFNFSCQNVFILFYPLCIDNFQW